MKKTFLNTFITCLLFNSTGLAENVKHSFKDPINDIHYNMKGTCKFQETDILSTDISRSENDFTLVITTKENIKDEKNYREFYFWLDIDPSKHNGYQPYNPHSVAWPNMFADYRIFTSLTFNEDENKIDQRVAIQDCQTDNCSIDSGLYSNQNISVTIKNNTVTFKWPSQLIPKLDSANKFLLGITTYHQNIFCNGEDDSPQWGKNAFLIEMKNSNDSGITHEGLLN